MPISLLNFSAQRVLVSVVVANRLGYIHTYTHTSFSVVTFAIQDYLFVFRILKNTHCRRIPLLCAVAAGVDAPAKNKRKCQMALLWQCWSKNVVHTCRIYGWRATRSYAPSLISFLQCGCICWWQSSASAPNRSWSAGMVYEYVSAYIYVYVCIQPLWPDATFYWRVFLGNENTPMHKKQPTITSLSSIDLLIER